MLVQSCCAFGAEYLGSSVAFRCLTVANERRFATDLAVSHSHPRADLTLNCSNRWLAATSERLYEAEAFHSAMM